MTDELLNYGVAPRALIPESIHDTDQNTNNRVAQSQDLNRERDQGMRWLKSGKSGAKLIGVHAVVYNLFNFGRHRINAFTIENSRKERFALGRRW